MACTGQPYANKVITVTINSVGFRNPANMVPSLALNVFPQVLQR